MGGHRFPINEHQMLVIDPKGAEGAFAIACALGLRVVPTPIAAAFVRPEWVDILAKLRGMMFANVHTLGYPIVRQFCGCQLLCDPHPLDDGRLSVIVKYCAGHTYPSRGDEHPAAAVTPVGRIETRDPGPDGAARWRSFP